MPDLLPSDRGFIGVRLIVATLFLTCLSAFGQLRTSVTLVWDYPPAELTNIAFYVRGNPTLTIPVTNWPVMGIVYASTNYPAVTNLTLPLEPQAYFFVCQASNLWGLSDPSNVAVAPAPPRSDIILRLR